MLPKSDLSEFVSEFLKDVPPGFSWTASSLRSEFEAAKTWWHFEGQSLIGFVCTREQMDLCEITVLGTHPQWRKKGIMAILLQKLIGEFKGSEIWLEVHEKNGPAQATYLKCGFQKVGERPRYYPDGGAAYLYSWRRPR